MIYVSWGSPATSLAEAVLPWDAANKPSKAWPAKTADESNAAWPAGQQPLNLIAWPKEHGQPSSCWKITVLQDTATGWSGSCEHLEEIAGLNTEKDCQQNCQKNPACAIWQFTTGMLCLQGTSLECDDTMQASQPLVRGQRLQHGDVRILRDMTGWQVASLRPLGMGSSNDIEDQVKRCREFCYTLLPCQYWSFGDGGCFVEDPTDAKYAAEYPLTLTYASDSTAFATSVSSGEYLQHICPAQTDDAAVAGDSLPVLGALQPSLEQPNSWPVIAAVSTLSILVVALTIGCCVCRRGEDDKALRSRSIGLGGRDEESEEEERSKLNSVDERSMPLAAAPGSPVRLPYDYAPVEQASPANSHSTIRSNPWQQTPTHVPAQTSPQVPIQQSYTGYTPQRPSVPRPGSFVPQPGAHPAGAYGGAYANAPQSQHSFTSLNPSHAPSAPHSFQSLGPGQVPSAPSAPHSFNSLTPSMAAQSIQSPKGGQGSPLFHH